MSSSHNLFAVHLLINLSWGFVASRPFLPKAVVQSLDSKFVGPCLLCLSNIVNHHQWHALWLSTALCQSFWSWTSLHAISACLSAYLSCLPDLLDLDPEPIWPLPIRCVLNKHQWISWFPWLSSTDLCCRNLQSTIMLCCPNFIQFLVVCLGHLNGIFVLCDGLEIKESGCASVVRLAVASCTVPKHPGLLDSVKSRIRVCLTLAVTFCPRHFVCDIFHGNPPASPSSDPDYTIWYLCMWINYLHFPQLFIKSSAQC